MAPLLFTFDARNVRATAARVWADPDYRAAAQHTSQAAARYTPRPGEPPPRVKPTTEAELADRLCDEAVAAFRGRWGAPARAEAVTPAAMWETDDRLHGLEETWRGVAVTFTTTTDPDAPSPPAPDVSQAGHRPARLVNLALPEDSTVRHVEVTFHTVLR